MKIRFILLLTVFFFKTTFSYSQEMDSMAWWNPAKNAFNVIGGQGWPDQVQSPYDRLPSKAEGIVRKDVWELSKHPAGLIIRFRSNASKISVRYQVSGKMEMPHMPATGVSGVDLYAKDSDGKWMWHKGKFSFKDTVQYAFSDITPNDSYHDKGREYHLYLPLYNPVEWLEIGVNKNALFEAIPIRREKPIVVYGTSIAQGACASRPGMAWTSILGRRMDWTLINLGFSGNGKLEAEVIDLMTGIDAKIYILDCLPNLALNKNRSAEDVHQLILSAVEKIRKRSSAPVLLVEHSGYSDGLTNAKRFKEYTELNNIMEVAFSQLKSEGMDNIYLLPQTEINLCLDCYVDGTHPSDLGMEIYASAYEKILRQILNQPIGNCSTTIPVTQARDPGMYNWEERHNEPLSLNKKNPPKICFYGNSISRPSECKFCECWDHFA